MGKRATIRDVAEKAGVSKSTVSLVLHDSPLVRSETKAAVNQAIAQLHYVRNRAAAALRNAKSGRVGIVVNDLRTPFVTEFVAAAQRSLMDFGQTALIASADEDPAAEDRAVRLALEHDISGLILAPCHGVGLPVFDTILAAEIPAIQVLRMGDPRLGDMPFYSMDYAIGSHLAARHLLDQGLTRVAFVGGRTGHQIARERASGYRDVMEVQRQKPLVLHGDATRRFGQEAMMRIARDHPDVQAAICINDLVALGMAAAAPKAGRRIGGDFFLVGFDDSPECAESDPPLSSVRCDVNRLADKCVRSLLAWVENDRKPPELNREPVELKIRESSRAR